MCAADSAHFDPLWASDADSSDLDPSLRSNGPLFLSYLVATASAVSYSKSFIVKSAQKLYEKRNRKQLVSKSHLFEVLAQAVTQCVTSPWLAVYIHPCVNKRKRMVLSVNIMFTACWEIRVGLQVSEITHLKSEIFELKCGNRLELVGIEPRPNPVSWRMRIKRLTNVLTNLLTYLVTYYYCRCCWQAASQVGHAANDGGATTSAIHCWPPSIHRARPHGLELLAGRPLRTAGLCVI